jgi:hypothetical protein
LELEKHPGIAEAIDWVAALMLLGAHRLDADVAGATLGSVLKSREDQAVAREHGMAWVAGAGG